MHDGIFLHYGASGPFGHGYHAEVEEALIHQPSCLAIRAPQADYHDIMWKY